MNLSQTQAVLADGIKNGVAPGFVFGYWSGEKLGQSEVIAMGERRKFPTSQPMLADTIFDFASVTKVLVTATLTALLVDRGWLRLDQSITSLLPEFPFPEITLKHLLSHTSGLPAWRPFYEDLRTGLAKDFGSRPLYKIPVEVRQSLMRKKVFEIPPEAPIETRTLYSDLSMLLMGFALEEALRMPLDIAAKELIFGPMGLGAHFRRTTKSVTDARDDRVAATEDCPWRGGVLQGQVHDDNCWAMGGYAGHAGAFGTASDLLRFSERLMGGFVSHETLRTFWRRVNLPVACERTPGWDTPSGPDSAAGRQASRESLNHLGTVGHLGYTGTSLWIDVPKKLAMVLLSNRVHPSRENILIRPFRARVHEAFYQDFITYQT